MFRVECLSLSGRVDRVILGLRRAGSTEWLQSKELWFVTRRALSLLTMRGRTLHLPPYRLVLNVVAICAIASTSSSIASYLGDPVMRGRSAASNGI